MIRNLWTNVYAFSMSKARPYHTSFLPLYYPCYIIRVFISHSL